LPRRSSARQDIVDFLSANGPVSDPNGRATAALKRAVGYEGNDSAFIQLISAMARDGQIQRVVRGRRTYELRLPSPASDRTNASAAPAPAPAPPAAPEQTQRETDALSETIDYDELAAALLARVTQLISDSEQGPTSIGWTKRRMERLETRNAIAERELARAKAELRAVEAERDELKSRLEAAEHNLNVLSERHHSSAARTSANRAARRLGTEDRALLHRLTEQQRQKQSASERTG
jgi:septal ring factor EnvC (AmiA/AmiB activator)